MRLARLTGKLKRTPQGGVRLEQAKLEGAEVLHADALEQPPPTPRGPYRRGYDGSDVDEWLAHVEMGEWMPGD